MEEICSKEELCSNIKGRIHSLENFGTVDGPGVRLVVFMQGCPMRCIYCHNPDTWDTRGGKWMEASHIIKQYERNISFYKRGGITVSGGEPLMQLDFLIELFRLAKEKNIHTCLDTSGATFLSDHEVQMKKMEKLMPLTDLVLLDIKHIDSEKHRELTSYPIDSVLDFISYLESKSKDMWLRHVIVPGITDDEKHLFDLGYYIGQFCNLKALDFLPYHNMGEIKYKKLGMEYRLKGVPSMEAGSMEGKKKIVLQGISKRRRSMSEILHE